MSKANYECKIDGTVDYKTAKAILNGEVECSPGEWDEAIVMATKCIDLLIYVAKEVNDASAMSSIQREKIRRKLNKELKGSNENFIHQSEW